MLSKIDETCKVFVISNVENDTKELNIATSREHDGVSFEDALNQTGIGRYNITLFFISISSLIAAAAELFSVALLGALTQCDLELDVYKKGFIGSVPMLGVIASAHIWGYVADTKGRKYSLIVSMSGTFIIAILSSFSNSWIFLTVTKFFSAACASGTNAVIYAMLGENTPESHRGKYLMYTASGVMMAQGINAAFAFPILHENFSHTIPVLNITYRPWRLLAQTYGLENLVCLIFLNIFVNESAKYHFAKGNNEEGLNILKKIYSVNSGKGPEEYLVKHVFLEEEVKTNGKQNFFLSICNQTAPLFYKQHICKTLLLSYISIMVFSVGPPFGIWAPFIFETYSQATDINQNICQLIQKDLETITNVSATVEDICNDQVTNFTLSVMAGISVYLFIITMISVFFIKYTGKKWMFVVTHLVCACLGLATNHVYGLWGIVLFTGTISSVMCMGISTTYAVELYPTHLRATGVCLTMMIGRAFSFIVINLFGVQLETNCDNFMYILSGFIFSGALVGLLLPSDKKKKE